MLIGEFYSVDQQIERRALIGGRVPRGEIPVTRTLGARRRPYRRTGSPRRQRVTRRNGLDPRPGDDLRPDDLEERRRGGKGRVV